MTQKEKKQFMQALDEFLACFDPEEMVRDGVQFIKFRYHARGKKIERVYTPETLRTAKEQRENAIH
jgi:hypothetical protein